MAKTPSSAIGIDLGRHSLKAVSLQRRSGNRISLNSFAVQKANLEQPDQLPQQVHSLLRELGGSAKACAVAISSSDAVLRIIEQPETPVELLRDMVRLNGMALLNQDCKDFVLDCQRVANGTPSGTPATGGRRKYLVGGVPRSHVVQIDAALQRSRTPLKNIQLAPISNFNAFEFSHRQVFDQEAFILVDIGYLSSTVAVGVKSELVMIRSIDYGAKALTNTLTGGGVTDAAETFRLLAKEDDVTIENAGLSLTVLTREISGSIGFFEGQREETISRIFVSGGMARMPVLLKLIGQELQRPCEAWNPFEHCEINLHANAKARLGAEASHLNVACGAAAELLNAS
jgi:type IV pilus assembly protein PilM